MASKKFDPEDFAAFLALLPKEKDGLVLRHALEVRHASFATEQFYDLARAHNVAIICAEDETFPEIDEPTADFSYARLMSSQQQHEQGVTPKQLTAHAKRARGWSDRGDVFVYFIAGAKERNPAAAQALIKKLKLLRRGSAKR